MEVDMSRSHLRAAGIVLVALLGFPSKGNASIIDFIWEMSGPQMFTWLTFDCEFKVQGAMPECRVYDFRLVGREQLVRAERPWWVALNGALYTSTGGTTKSSRPFVAFQNHMFGFDPVLRHKVGRFRQGAGFTYHHIWGADFKTFNKLGIKLEAITVPAGIFNFTLVFRIYPDKFTHQQFRAPGTPGNGKREVTVGLDWEIR
jgi:hypothetical protein